LDDSVPQRLTVEHIHDHRIGAERSELSGLFRRARRADDDVTGGNKKRRQWTTDDAGGAG
jgi:hypothetical protein